MRSKKHVIWLLVVILVFVYIVYADEEILKSTTQKQHSKEVIDVVNNNFPSDIDEKLKEKEKKNLPDDKRTKNIKHESITVEVPTSKDFKEKERIVVFYTNGWYGKLVIFERKDSSFVKQWESSDDFEALCFPSLEVRDLNNDGGKEILLQAATGMKVCTSLYIFTRDNDNYKGVYIADKDGAVIRKAFSGYDVEIKDMDGDKIYEIIETQEISDPQGGNIPLGYEKITYKWKDWKYIEYSRGKEK